MGAEMGRREAEGQDGKLDSTEAAHTAGWSSRDNRWGAALASHQLWAWKDSSTQSHASFTPASRPHSLGELSPPPAIICTPGVPKPLLVFLIQLPRAALTWGLDGEGLPAAEAPGQDAWHSRPLQAWDGGHELGNQGAQGLCCLPRVTQPAAGARWNTGLWDSQSSTLFCWTILKVRRTRPVGDAWRCPWEQLGGGGPSSGVWPEDTQPISKENKEGKRL